MQHALKGKQFEVVLAIDVAYQWPLSTWLQQASLALKPAGRLGFHTLIRTPNLVQAAVITRAMTHVCLRMIGMHHIDTQASLQHKMSEGFHRIHIEDISQPVLAGFGQFSQRLPLAWRTQPLGSLKIALTGCLCRFLMRHQGIAYVAVSAHKSSPPV